MRGVKRAVTPKVKNGVLWLDFNYKPDFAQRKALKIAGFRWSPNKGAWWSKNTTQARQVANSLNLTEFIAKPVPTENDFMDWEKSLSPTDWHNFVTEVNEVYEKLNEDGPDVAVQVMTKYLHDKFIAQWV